MHKFHQTCSAFVDLRQSRGVFISDQQSAGLCMAFNVWPAAAAVHAPATPKYLAHLDRAVGAAGEMGASLRNCEVAVVAASVLLSAAAGKQQGAAAALGDGAVACEPS